MKLAITGATGFVGGRLLDAATAAGYKCRALTRRSMRPRVGVAWIEGALDDEESLARLAEVGQCRKTDVGALSLSRPVYAVLSTGLEADRTGARFNDDSSALAAESVWDVAREAGLEDAIRPLVEVRLADLERLGGGSPPPVPPAA